MKKAVTIILTCVIFLGALCGCSIPGVTATKEIQYKKLDKGCVVTELPSATGISEIVIPDEYEGLPVTEIGDFSGCNLEYAEKIAIGKNVKKIGSWAFTNNQKLRAFSVDADNPYFCTRDGAIYTRDMKELVSFPCGGALVYKIPEGVEVIRSKAFYKCKELETLTLPSTLKSIEEKAFFRCEKLKSICLPEGLETIEKDAFSYCSELSEAVIPKTVTTIGEYAFYNCTSLLNVTVEGRKEDISFGKSWEPTNNGLPIGELKIMFTE